MENEIRSYSKTFQTNQSDLIQHNGKTFEVLRPLTEKEIDIKEVGPMYEIKLSTGEVIHAFEDEIGQEEQYAKIFLYRLSA